MLRNLVLNLGLLFYSYVISIGSTHLRKLTCHTNKCPKHLLAIGPYTNQIVKYIKPRLSSIHQLPREKE